QLSGLTGTAMSDLLAALAGGKPDGNLLRLADGAAGNPLYLTELVAALARSSSLTVTEAGAAELASGSAPGSLSAAIADRLGFVAGPVREVLRAAALLGMDFAVPDLAIVLGRSVADLIPAVDEACAVGVLAESGQGLGFRHPLIRAALYDEMPAPVRAAWHRDAGRALAAAGAPPDRGARQMLGTGSGSADAKEPMDEWMLDWLGRTADLLVGQAPGVAAELLTRPAASSPADSARHGWLASRLADAAYRVGDRAQAEQVANRALEHAVEPDLLADLHWTLAQCRMLAGLSAESLATLDRALTVTQADPALTDLRLLLQLNQAVTLGNLDRYEEALAAAGQARDLADQVGTTFRLTQAHCALGQLLFQTGRWDDALAEVEILHEDLKEPAVACCDRGIAAVIGFHRGEVGAARGHLAAAAPHAERLGHRLITSLALARSLDCEHDGALPEALAALTEAFDGNPEEVEEIE